jgi:hypothetical protein
VKRMSDDEFPTQRPHGKGVDHHDDRNPLGYAYDGDELVAILFKMEPLRDLEEKSVFSVVRTPEGEAHA